MFIYSVMRYGNDDDGPDGDDTEFLVLADSVEQAASVVDLKLKEMPHEKVSSFCHAIALIGESYSQAQQPIILLGPLLTHLSLLDFDIPEENIYRRSLDVEEGVWVVLSKY